MTAFLSGLVGQGFLTDPDRTRVEALIGSTDEPWDQIVCRLGLMTEVALTAALAKETGLPIAEPHSEAYADDRCSTAFLRAGRALLLREKGETVIGLVDPFESGVQEGASFALGRELIIRLLSASRYEALLLTVEAMDNSEVLSSETADVAFDAEWLADMASSEPVVRRVNALIAEASARRASDVHLEPHEGGFAIRSRVDGVLGTAGRMSRSEGLAVVSRVKILADLDIAERRRPQDGRFTFPVAGQKIDLRVSTVPTDYGESAVLRLLDRSSVALDYASLGYSEAQATTIQSFLHRPYGLVLLTGPTGSGKTTSLYTFLQDLADGSRKILTVEDPIEYRLARISQSQIDPAIGVTFASQLRSFLRHDPDVMMVGEIRDIETARIAVQAALTGHLVLSTLHTNDAPSAVTRLRDLGLEDYLLAATLNGVVSQRLVSRLCTACTGRGCGACGETGRRGRVAVAEALTVNDSVAEAIRAGAPEAVLREKDSQFVPIAADAWSKAQASLIAAGDAARVLGQPVTAP
ncbi:GspE/PulE family protein [Parvularcula oceani]|uniref:GspE/PulE family protein n=1 Tax=Parvularcula oceani TaxID=1247963 RepID=UPI00138E3CAE|nr:GspE/PulE family protein [Parvularcula oceani]